MNFFYFILAFPPKKKKVGLDEAWRFIWNYLSDFKNFFFSKTKNFYFLSFMLSEHLKSSLPFSRFLLPCESYKHIQFLPLLHSTRKKTACLIEKMHFNPDQVDSVYWPHDLDLLHIEENYSVHFVVFLFHNYFILQAWRVSAGTGEENYFYTNCTLNRTNWEIGEA